jgi:hypothetical protein
LSANNKEAQRHKTSKKEWDNMRVLIARDLADAGTTGLSADGDSRLLATLHSRRGVARQHANPYKEFRNANRLAESVLFKFL